MKIVCLQDGWKTFLGRMSAHYRVFLETTGSHIQGTCGGLKMSAE